MRLDTLARTSFLALTLALPLGATAIASDDDKTVGQEVEEAVNAIQAAAVEQKDEAMAEGEEALEALDRELAEMEASMAEAGEEAREAWADRKAELAEMRDDLAAQLEDFGEAAGDTWDQVKAETSAAFTNFAQAVDESVDFDEDSEEPQQQ